MWVEGKKRWQKIMNTAFLIWSFSANYYSHFVCLFSVNDPERHSWAARPGVHSTSPCGDQQIDARGGPLLVGHPHQLEWTADILRHAGQLWCAASVLWWLVSLVSVRAVGLAYLLFAVHRVRRAWVSRLLEGLDKCYCVGTVILLFFFFNFFIPWILLILLCWYCDLTFCFF